MTAKGKAWFAAYTGFLGATRERLHANPAQTSGGYHCCPCCAFPTLEHRARFEICLICWWEDDGQDDPDADLATGGPNGAYSLTDARENFLRDGSMYAPEDAIDIVANPSPARRSLLAYVSRIQSGDVTLNLKVLHDHIEGLNRR